MPRLQAIQLDENTVIYVEVSEDPDTTVSPLVEPEQMRSTRSATPQQMIRNFASLQDTIKSFAVYTLNSFKEISCANVDKVTLEFGVNIGEIRVHCVISPQSMKV